MTNLYPILAPLSDLRTKIVLPENQVLDAFHSTVFGVRQPAFDLSPDGSRLVYVANSNNGTQLFLHPMNQFEARPISGTEGVSVPFFSPDSQTVDFFAGEKLKVVSLRVGEPMTICDASFPQT
jgi:Tol biopolymer transport system component